MKRKPELRSESIVPKEILERAKELCETDQLKPPSKCVICGSPRAPKSIEELCWVCRRLKISAWRESDQQMPAQE